MKKLILISLAIIMALSMTVAAFAATVSSPVPSPIPSPTPGTDSPSPTPGTDSPIPTPPEGKVVLVEAKPGSPLCKAEIVITTYDNREYLADAAKAELEAAYNSLKNATDLTTLNADLSKLAADGKIAGKDLAATEIFDMDYKNCDKAAHNADHGEFSITLKVEELKNFVGILHYNNGAWELLSDVKVNGEKVSFKIDEFSPFAIVVNTNPATEPPITGDALVYICAAIMLVSAAAFVVCFKKTRKVTN